MPFRYQWVICKEASEDAEILMRDKITVIFVLL
jgi:hypothetical protein